MQFKRLRLAGFKSFVEPVELRIEAGLTGVVGPNGCGKSNLLEAIRWVMGEGSAKSLRGGGMEDVIFAGTATRPSREFADVTLVLDNDDRSAPVGFNDSDTIEVVRRIERGLGSAYRLNGRDVRQRDVQLLFADAATGAHSPALVSQGRIGSIVAAKPVERRLLLEEAAGISGLHVRRREAEIRLRAADANMTRLDDMLKSLEAQATSLRRQVRQAERYRQLSDRIRLVEAQLLFARWRAADTAAKQAGSTAAAIEVKVVEMTRDVARLTTLVAHSAADIPGLRNAAATAAAAWQVQFQAANAAVNERLQAEARQVELGRAAELLRRDTLREDVLASDISASLLRLAAEATALSEKQAAVHADLPILSEAVAAAGRVAADAESKLGAAIEAQATAVAQARAATAAVESSRQRLDRAENELARFKAELAQLRANDEFSPALEAAERALSAAILAAASANDKVNHADLTRRSAEAARELAQESWLASRAAVAALLAERDALQRQLVSALATAKAGVADSIAVDVGFEAALAAAFGDDLSAPLGTAITGRFWEAAPGDGDPDLPPGVIALSNYVAAPAELMRRLRQIGVVDAVDGIVNLLKPGQRLVTRDGRLWRWDGFRAFGGQGAAAAERFIARNRLEVVLVEVEAAQIAEAASRIQRDEADRQLAVRSTAERAAREDRNQAEAAVVAARTQLAARTVAAQQRAGQMAALSESISRIAEEAICYRREASEATVAAELVVDLAALAHAAILARRHAEAARDALTSARAKLEVVTRDEDAGRQRYLAIDKEQADWSNRQVACNAQQVALSVRADAIALETAHLATLPQEIGKRQAAIAGALAAAEAERQATTASLQSAEQELHEAEQALRSANEQLAAQREARATAIANAEHADLRCGEIAQVSQEKFGCSPMLLPKRQSFDTEMAGDSDDLGSALEVLIAERERIGAVNLRAESELEELEVGRTGSIMEREELETAIARLRGSIGALNREGRSRLLEAFKVVDSNFRELFSTLFVGGAAHLELIESDDPLESGLEIMAQPPGKKLQSLTLLSGGEQALTAVALIFALFLTNPAPICVLDEVDAPLDDANVERFCDLLDRMAATTATRFLIVTHNAVTMSRMHRLYGVTMAEQGVSQLVSVDLARAELLLAAQ